MHFSGAKREHIHNGGSSNLDMKRNPSHPCVQKDRGELAQRKAKRMEKNANNFGAQTVTLQLRSEVAESSAVETHKILSIVEKADTTQKVKDTQSNYEV